MPDGSLPTGMRVTTRCVRESSRTTSPFSTPPTHAEPKPDASAMYGSDTAHASMHVIVSFGLSHVRDTSSGRCPTTTLSSSPPRVSTTAPATTAIRTATAVARPTAEAGDGIDARRPRDQPAETAAALLSALGLGELELEPGHEVLPHGRGPIRWRTAASPRLTRLRTTASDVCEASAISS